MKIETQKHQQNIRKSMCKSKHQSPRSLWHHPKASSEKTVLAKSTLMKILSGFISYDTGQLLIDDQPVLIQSPADAVTAGIGMLHQGPTRCPPNSPFLDNFIMQQNGKFHPQSQKSQKRAHPPNRKIQFSN